MDESSSSEAESGACGVVDATGSGLDLFWSAFGGSICISCKFEDVMGGA